MLAFLVLNFDSEAEGRVRFGRAARGQAAIPQIALGIPLSQPHWVEDDSYTRSIR
jgi:hypothetical protein